MDCRLCSIDASTTSTGISYFLNGEYQSSTLIQYDDKIADSRFNKMCLAILRELDTLNPYIIYMEEAANPRNPHTQRLLVRLQGVVYSWAISHGADCEFIRPSSWRSLVGIKSKGKRKNELKIAAIEMVKSIFNITVNDDVAESILIGIAAINKYNPDLKEIFNE